MSFWSFLGVAAADAAVEGSENQITFENFIVQAKKRNVLSSKPDCGGKKPNGDDYLTLYDALVDAKVIVNNATKGSLWTWTSSYTISTSISLEANSLQSVLKKKQSSEYTKLTQCFTVDFAKLSDMLKTYKYDPSDQINAIKEAVGGRKKTRKQYRQSCRKTPKFKSKRLSSKKI